MSPEEWLQSQGGTPQQQVLSPEEWARQNIPAEPPLATTQSAIEQSTKPGFFDPTQPQPFSVGNVATSTGIGAGLGTLLGGPIGGAAGAVSGLASGVAGEVARTSGASPAVTLGAEIVAGGLPTAVKKFGSKAIGIIDWKSGRLAGLADKLSDADYAAMVAKEKQFGTPTFKGLYTTKNSDEIQNALKTQLRDSGIQVGDNELASTAVRKQLYSDMSATKPFAKSAEYGDLQDELAVLRARNLISPKEEVNLDRILKNQLNTNPKVAATANRDILNLIQNGGSYTVEGETKTMISPDAQKLLRDYFNKYLETNTGKQGYNFLKGIEEQEFIAQARDSIPTIVATRFTKIDAPYKEALGNIAKSPEGKSEFVKAIDQHFYQFGKTATVNGKEVGKEVSSDNLMKEFIRLRPAIEETGVMTRDQLVDLTKRISGLPKAVDNAKLVKTMSDLIRSSIIGAGASEVSSSRPIVMPM